jgi:hypothetical protein
MERNSVRNLIIEIFPKSFRPKWRFIKSIPCQNGLERAVLGAAGQQAFDRSVLWGKKSHYVIFNLPSMIPNTVVHN